MCDLSGDVLETILPAFTNLYPAPNLADPSTLCDERERLTFVAVSARHSVVEDIRTAIRQRANESSKPRVIPEAL